MFHVYSLAKKALIRCCLSQASLRDRMHDLFVQYSHRRRIELEDKAKVVASDWGTESLPR